MQIETNKIVTLKGVDPNESNTYLIDTVEEGSTLLLSHPIAPGCLFRVHQDMVDTVAPILKSSSERSLDYALRNTQLFTQGEIYELRAISFFFFYVRFMTDRQKKFIADLCGRVAKEHFSGNVNKAMSCIQENEGVLDEFNRLWYKNFHKLFDGSQKISSGKQKQALFNMAGFVLAELQNPSYDISSN